MTDSTDYQPDIAKIVAALSASFSEQELRSLCLELRIEYEDLPPGGKTDKARELAQRCQRERRLPELAEAILRERQHIPRHSLLRDTRTDQSPFKGLLAFQEEDEAIFYGRETLTTDLLARLLSPVVRARQLDSSLSGKTNVLPTASPLPTTFLALVGASGSGKSSVVRAGLIPALRRQTNWPIHLITPTAHPLEALAVTLTRESESITAVTTLIDDMTRDPRSLHLYVRRLLAQDEGVTRWQGDKVTEEPAVTLSPGHLVTPSSHLLLVVDQFEELFTLCKDEAEQKAFVENLVYAVNPETAGPTSVILTLRADFYSHCLQFAPLHRLLEQQQKIVPAMTAAELRAAIEQPAARAGLVFEEGLVDLLLRDVGDEPGNLPLLSHVLLETWQRREGNRLTLAGYTAAGGVQGAIAKTAESTYQNLTPDQQTIARSIFLRLTELGEGVQDTRRRADLEELRPRAAAAAEVDTVLKLLADARLVTTDAAAAEVSHEALIREWPTLRRWLDEDREGLRIHRQLTEDAVEWEKTGRDVHYLYRGGRLAQAREWAAAPGADLNDLEQAFLDAGLAQQQDELAAAKATAAREADAARKLRQRAVFLRGALVIAAALAIISFLLYGQSSRNARQAEENEQQAFVESTRAFNNQGTAVAEAATAEAAQVLAVANEGTAQAQAVRADANAATAVYNEQLAATREVEANDQRRKALVQSLAALSAVAYERDQNPELAILLGMEAAQNNESSQAGADFLVDPALRAVLQEYAYYPVALSGHEAGVISVAFSPDGQRLASGSWDRTIRLWALNDPTAEPVVLRGHEGAVNSVAFSPDGQTLASGSNDGTIRLWAMNDPTAEPVVLRGHGAGVTSVAFSPDPDGQMLASGSSDNTIRLWALNDPTTEPVVLRGHQDPVYSVAFSRDGQTLASGSGDRTIRLWAMNDPTTETVVLRGHGAGVPSVAFSPDGQTLASGSWDRTIRLWAMNDLTAEPEVLRGHEDGVLSVAFSRPDGQTLASGSWDRTIRLWALNDPTAEPEVLRGHEDEVNSVAFSPDGQTLASGSNDGAIRLWAMNDPTAEPVVLYGHEDGVLSVAFSRPDGQTLASGSNDGAIRLWAMNDPTTEPVVLRGHGAAVLSVAFSPDGQTLASGSSDGAIHLWAMNDPTAEPVVLRGHEASVMSVAFSPDGQRLASGSWDRTIRLWAMNDPTAEPVVLYGHEDGVLSVAFSRPDGQTLASGSNDGAIRLWSMNDPTDEPMVLRGHESAVNSVAFSEDGQTLISGSWDNTIRLWALNDPTAEPVVLRGHEAVVNSVAFSPDGQTLASGSNDGTIRLWPTLEVLVTSGCQQVGRNLNWAEWQRYLPGEPYRQTCPNLPRHPSVPPDA